MKNFMLAAVVFAVSGTAIAATKKPLTVRQQIASVNRDATACGKTAETTYKLKMCAGTYADASQQVVDDLVASITKNLSSAGDDDSKEVLKRLQASQGAWIAFRDANASLAGADDLGGTLESVDMSNAMGEMAQKRALELAARFDGSQK